MGKLTDKVAVITGGSSGIGLATAKEFLSEGARVVITGRRQEVIESALQELAHKDVVGIQGDVASLADLDRLVAEVEKQFGRIDVYFANAGVSFHTPPGTVTEQHFDQHFDVNVKGLFFGVQKALRLMGPGSSIILCGSVVAFRGMANRDVYAASKAAVRSLARTWTVDLKQRRIRVNVLSPGPIATPLGKKLGLTDEQLEKAIAAVTAKVPMERLGQPAEIGRAAVFLASDDSSFITGIDLCVDGGMGQV
jgi:NAD(P)-dependent dehydrogenase (short-subunit alcohol dehydrogenase family)